MPIHESIHHGGMNRQGTVERINVLERTTERRLIQRCKVLYHRIRGSICNRCVAARPLWRRDVYAPVACELNKYFISDWARLNPIRMNTPSTVLSISFLAIVLLPDFAPRFRISTGSAVLLRCRREPRRMFSGLRLNAARALTLCEHSY